MNVVGQVESLWRYPVKSMRGEETPASFAGFSGIYGDRYYAFLNSAAPKGFPYLTAREQGRMLLYRPVFRHAANAAKPPNLAEAEQMAPGVTPVYGGADDLMLDVETPDGDRMSIDDPRLLTMLRAGLRDGNELSLIRSDRALSDCRPISLFSIQTAHQLSEELGFEVNKRRFRANIYLDLAPRKGFDEDSFVGSRLRIGEKAVVAVVDRDPRCKMITLDADTAQPNPDVMKRVAQSHEGKAGLYGAVVVEGMIRTGDQVTLLN